MPYCAIRLLCWARAQVQLVLMILGVLTKLVSCTIISKSAVSCKTFCYRIDSALFMECIVSLFINLPTITVLVSFCSLMFHVQEWECIEQAMASITGLFQFLF